MPSQPEPRRCLSIDYDGIQCSLDAGHDGHHKKLDRRGRMVTSWPKLYEAIYGRMTNDA